MATNYSYKFSLTAPTPPYKAVEPLFEHAYDEFTLNLPRDWKPAAPTAANAFDFVSEYGAAIAVSVDLRETPDGEQAALAEAVLDGRRQAMEQLAPGRVEVLHRTVKPHAGGAAQEAVFSAELDGGSIYSCVAYVTSRKVITFGLTSRAGRQRASDLFNNLVVRAYQPRLP